MVLSGEGADEVFGGYLYFHKAPTAQAFHQEAVRKLGENSTSMTAKVLNRPSRVGVEAECLSPGQDFLDTSQARLNPEAKDVPRRAPSKRNSPQSLCRHVARQC